MELKIKNVNTTTSSDGSQYGKFVIEPLERGFGATIGNSLRRVLLSSLEGAAVTSVRIEGITHEYTSIPGIVEDVIDIMLNLKGLVVKTETDEIQHLRIDATKPGPVLASDIQLPSGVKIVKKATTAASVCPSGARRSGFLTQTTPFTSRACGPDCKPQQAFRDQPPQAALRPRSRLRATLGQDAPHGLGVTGRMLFWVPDQNNALRFSGFQPEARLRATLGQDAPHGRGVSDPSPCAPPR